MNTILFLLLAPQVLWAQLSPGKLSRPHAELEGIKNCSQCHARKAQISAERCLSCHQLLKERIDQKKGLHANEGYETCQSCHVEHQGENYSLIWWPDGKERFNHGETGYELQGKHKTLSCEACHNPTLIVEKAKFIDQVKDLSRTFLGLNSTCLTCHDDEHRQQLGDQCAACHNMDRWKPADKFDHQSARFQLVGRHQTVACGKCHPLVQDNKLPNNPDYRQYKGVAFSTCNNCHADPHNNRFGADCEKCHTPNGWRSTITADFDHSRTRFPLLGRHQTVACEKCHSSKQSIKIIEYEQCSDCHADYHQGQFAHRPLAGACEECHTVEGFSPSTFTVAQHEKTGFPLRESHLATPCNGCHSKSNSGLSVGSIRFRFDSSACIDCHSNPHGNGVGAISSTSQCEQCHNVSNWNSISFDHQQTGFPLKGRHREIRCKACHQTKISVNGNPPSAVPITFSPLSTQCERCHADAHGGQFKIIHPENGESYIGCERCHTPTDWLAEKFDHNRDSRFKLDGAHLYVKCEQCHQVSPTDGDMRLYKFPRIECSFCHDAQ
jgi:hypothetical protein